jgi:hypothetical protein
LGTQLARIQRGPRGRCSGPRDLGPRFPFVVGATP